MALFAYKAMNPDGRIVLGRLDAINAIDLELRLKRMELDFITGQPVRQGGLTFGASVSRRELINFCFHLEQMIGAGVPILEGLTDLRDSLENPRFREVIAGMIESIDGGKTLSQAMMEHPKVFDGVFASLVRAGESSGNLPRVLNDLVESLKWQDELASQTKKLLTYPVIMGTIVFSAVIFLMIYLVPKMVSFIRSSGQQLPLYTKILIAVSNVFVNYWYLVIGLPVLAALALAVLVHTSADARYRVDEFKLRLPVAGVILRKIILSRFASVFAMLYASGISVLESLHTTEGVVGNLVIRRGLERVGDMIAEGQGITVAFQNVGLFPPLVVRMLRVGENTGNLDTALTNVGYFYGRDVKESIARAQVMVEPIMIMVMGLMILWVGLSVFGPIYDSITRLKT